MGIEPLRLSPAECRTLESLCRVPSTRATIGIRRAGARNDRAVWRRIWRFPDARAAARWNAGWEAQLSGGEALHPALVGRRGGPPFDPLQVEVSRIVARVLADEVEAGGLYPTALDGGAYELQVEHVYHVSPLAWARSSFSLSLVGSVLDTDGRLMWAFESSREYPLDKLDEDVARHLIEQHWESTDEVFG